MNDGLPRVQGIRRQISTSVSLLAKKERAMYKKKLVLRLAAVMFCAAFWVYIISIA